jgi:hypothetical protein
MPDGVLKSVPAHRVVNVGTDPSLREPALDGSLHRFESGEALAVPFVYHDPAARKFALVIPSVLRHRELAERARLLGELAADADHPIPAYVRHFAVVVGIDELVGYLRLPPVTVPPLEAARRAAAADERARELEQWAADLGERERAVALQQERLQGQADDLAAREAELVVRWQSVERPSSERVGDDEVEEVDDAVELEEMSGSPAFVADPDTDVDILGEGELVDPSEVEEVPVAAADEVTDVSDLDVEPLDQGTEADASTETAPVPIHVHLDRLDEPGGRGQAALALALEGHADTLDALFAVLGHLTPDELVAVMAALCSREGLAADHLIAALGAPEPYVRHGAALALGELRPAHALAALVQLVQDEPEDLWQEAARVLGRFGKPAFEAMQESLAGLPGREERFAYALAALAEQGCDDDLTALRISSDSRVAKMAREAMALREVLRGHQEVVDGEAPAEAADPVRAFSRRFQQALGGGYP